MSTSKKGKGTEKGKGKSTKSRGKETVVVSVGGSLISPEGIDTSFMQSFKRCVLGYGNRSKRFVVVCGGGSTARTYQQAAARITQLESKDVDWLGIYGTRINAQLMRTVLQPHAGKDIVTDISQDLSFARGASVMVVSGWKPGWSTDYVAVMLARKFGATRIANLSNIDHVYNKDPKEHQDAHPIKDMTWKEFRAMIPAEWDPGLSSPFDPVASKEADKYHMEVSIINGKKLAQFEHFLNERPFRGTRIHPKE